MLKVRLGLIVAVFNFVLSSVSTPVNDAEVAPNTEGEHDGYFYQWKISSPNENATFTNGPGGSFSVNWGTSAARLRGGKGWKVGSFNRKIEFSVDKAWSGGSWNGVYGRTSSPDVEYCIVDSFGTMNPGSVGAYKGTYKVNGTSYNIYHQAVPFLLFPDEDPNRKIVWAVTQPPQKTKGVVDVGAHVKAWRDAGVMIGTVHGIQLVVQEAFYSSGSSTMQFSEVS